jgi:CheY-like chemotaxis protein
MKGARVLIVEDEAIVAFALRVKLESWGYIATSIERCGAAAIAAFDRDRPDCALLDIFLADSVDGIEVARHIANNSPVPFVFLTASQDGPTRERALAARPAGIVPKPYSDSSLRTVLERIFRTDADIV